jgi:hypothetical protein
MEKYYYVDSVNMINTPIPTSIVLKATPEGGLGDIMYTYEQSLAKAKGVWVPKAGEDYWSIVLSFGGNFFVEKGYCPSAADKYYTALSMQTRLFQTETEAIFRAKELNDQLAKLCPESSVWNPGDGQQYYHIGGEGKVYKSRNTTQTDRTRISIGNAFKTKADADKHTADFKKFFEGRK